MKLEVQYWGQAMQTIKLVDNAYESISGHIGIVRPLVNI